MPNTAEDKFETWSVLTVLFDNFSYIVVSTMHGGERRLGERWSGDWHPGLSFPRVTGYAIGGNAVWHIVPRFLEIPMLHGLLDELARSPQGSDPPKLILQELRNRLEPVAST